MPALQGALALPHVADGFAVADDLHLDVARLLDAFFEVDVAVTEGLFGLGAAAFEGLLELVLALDRPHAAAAAAGDGLDEGAAAGAE